MQPNQPQRPPDTMDYLNSIASPAPPARPNTKGMIVFGILGAMLLVSVLIVFNSLHARQSATTSPLPLVARLQKLETISSEYHARIRSSALQNANSSLQLALQTANYELSELLGSYGIDPKKQSKEISAIEENDTAELKARLDEALLNAQFEDTYAREIVYELEGAQFLMNRLKRTTKSASVQKFLDTTTKEFDSLKKRFSEAQSVRSS